MNALVIPRKEEGFSGENRFNIKKDASGNVAGAGAEKDRQADQTSYTMPDGSSLKIGLEKKVAPEILFRPDMIGLEYPGVHEMVANCIFKCDIDLRKALFGSIVVAGSTT